MLGSTCVRHCKRRNGAVRSPHMKWALLTAAVVSAAVYAGLALAGGHSSVVKVVLAPKGDPAKLVPSTHTAGAGPVTFVVTNQANIPHKSYGVPDSPQPHELLVIRTNRAPDQLPTYKARSYVTGNAI